MAKQVIDNSGTTDSLAAGMGKANSNFTELYNAMPPVGTVVDYIGLSPPDGWLLLNGTTIGSASSAADFADNDSLDLFTLLYENFENAQAPVSGGRGANASVDFAANKTITLPNSQGRVIAGYGGGSFTTLGLTIGNETHVLSDSELPIIGGHSHLIGDSVGIQYGSDDSALTNSGSNVNTGSSGGFGSGDAHNNVQPSLVLNKIIKY